MKRAVGVILLCVIVIIFSPKIVYSEGECQKELFINMINVINFNDFLNQQSYKEEIREICTNDFCMPITYSNMKKELIKFREKYERYVQKKSGDDESIRVTQKGFPITKIFLKTC